MITLRLRRYGDPEWTYLMIDGSREEEVNITLADEDGAEDLHVQVQTVPGIWEDVEERDDGR